MAKLPEAAADEQEDAMKVLFIGGTGLISSACSELAVKEGKDLYYLPIDLKALQAELHEKRHALRLGEKIYFNLLEIDLLQGEIRNLTRAKVFKAAPYPDFIRELVAAGGLVEYARRLLGHAGRPSGEREK